MQNDGTQMYRAATVAEKLNVSRSTVYRLIESGQLHAVRVGVSKGAVRIPENSLNSYLASVGLPSVAPAAKEVI
jgi:excisionase family DNA binding protein